VIVGCRKSLDSVRTSNGLEKWQITTLASYEGQPAISHDGRYVVHTSTQAGDPHIWVYDLNEQSRAPLTANEGHDGFANFSSDDRWVAFSSVIEGQSDIWLLSQDGDMIPVTKSSNRDEWAPTFADHDSVLICVFRDSAGFGLAEINRFRFSDFSIIYRDSTALDRPSLADNKIYFQRASAGQNDILCLERKFRSVSTIVSSNDDEIDPAVSPDGHWLAFARKGKGDTFYQLRLTSLVDDHSVDVAPENEDQRFPAWTQDGKNILYEGCSKWVIKEIDAETQVDTIIHQSSGNVTQPILSQSGEKLIFIEELGGRRKLRNLDLHSGSASDVSVGPVMPDEPDLSSDGSRIAFTGTLLDQHNVFVIVHGSSDTALQQITFDGSSSRPRFSRNGKTLYFVSARNGSDDIWQYDFKSKQSHVLTIDEKNENDPAEGPDGFVMFSAEWANRWSIWQMPVGGGMPLPLTRDKTPYAWDRDASLSPDGRLILFTRSWYDDADIWLMRADGGEKSTRTLTKDNVNHETHGRWSPDGRHVVFQAGHNSDIWMLDIQPLINDRD